MSGCQYGAQLATVIGGPLRSHGSARDQASAPKMMPMTRTRPATTVVWTRRFDMIDSAMGRAYRAPPERPGQVAPAATVVIVQAIRLERRDHLLIATIDHPTSEMNAVDQMLHDDFSELFAQLKREGQARAIVLTGGDKRSFSAGGDFGWFPTLRSIEALDHLRRAAKQIVWDLLDVEVPIVCALNGSAAGLGASIALLCDVVVMSDRAVDRRPARQRRAGRR